MLEIRLTEAPDPADGWYWQLMDLPHQCPRVDVEIAAAFAPTYSAAAECARDAFDKISAYRTFCSAA